VDSLHKREAGGPDYVLISERTGHGALTVMCALTPIYRHRAVRLVGEAGVQAIERMAAEIAAEAKE
jgi:hypothetical protein